MTNPLSARKGYARPCPRRSVRYLRTMRGFRFLSALLLAGLISGACAHLSAPTTPAISTIDVTLEDGSVTSLSYLLGKVVIIDICASYYGPCLINANMMREACTEVCSDDVVFMSMVLDEGDMSLLAVHSYKTSLKATQDVVRPGPETWAGRTALGKLAIPRLVVFDKNGDIYEEVAGATISGVALMNRAVNLRDD